MRKAREWLAVCQREGRAALELVILPGLAALLPWAVCFRCFKWLCQHTNLYGAEAHAALAQAKRYGVVDDPERWLWQRQLVTLVDHADLYLSRFRTARWLRRHLVHHGAWPAPEQAGVLLTFHWGAGMWALKDASTAGLHPHMLLALGHDAGSMVANKYLRARARQVQRCSGRPVVPVDVQQAQGSADGSGRRRVDHDALQAVLDAREQLLAVIDVPADQVGRSVPITLNAWPARAPLGLFELCARRGVPLTVYWTDVCLDSGRRDLVIRHIPPSTDAAQLVAHTFAELAALLRSDPQKWHFWALADRYFVGD